MNIWEEIKATFRKGSTLTRLIYVNLAVFLLVNLVEILFYLFGIHDDYQRFLFFFSVPSALDMLILKPWTLISYMFLHKNFLHILFNLLWLFWFGRIFMEYLDGRRLLNVYILGGLSGAVLYIITFNLFPVFDEVLPYSHALGASAAVMAIVIAISVYVPDYKIYLLFIGPTRIIYVAIFGFIFSSLIDFSINTGGKIAHIGGAAFGYLFALQLKKGKDFTRGFGRFMDKVVGIFKPKPKVRVTYRGPGKPETDYEYKKRKKVEQDEIDRILEKIARSGYDSLSKKEKEVLFKQSKNP